MKVLSTKMLNSQPSKTAATKKEENMSNVAKFFDKETNELKGYCLNIDGKNVIISPTQARDIYDTLETDYHKEDILLELENRGVELPVDEKDNMMSEILRLYEKNLSNDDSWHTSLDCAIDEVIGNI